MPVKKILLSFSLLLLCKVSFALVFVPEPYAKFNFTKTHYLVSVPDSRNYDAGYTAVFEAKTNKFLYKLDVFFDDYRVFLSDDGKELIYVEGKFESLGDSTEETYNICFFDGKKVTSILEVYKTKTLEALVYAVFDIDLESNSLSLFTKDLIFDVRLSEKQISIRENNMDRNVANEKISEDFMNTDSIMGIQNILLANDQSLKEKLLQDLKLKEVPDQASAQIVIYYNLRVSKDNTFSKVQFQTFGLPKKGSSRSNHKLLTKLNDEINEKVKSYSYSERIIPEGVDYWIYDGKIFVTE